jgi:hypothetical protein
MIILSLAKAKIVLHDRGKAEWDGIVEIVIGHLLIKYGDMISIRKS